MDNYLDWDSLKKAFIFAIENYIEVQKSLPAFENGHVSIWGKEKDIIAVKIENGQWKVVITNCRNPQKMKEEIESLEEENLQIFFEALGYKLPKQHGTWTGVPGFSTWIPDDNYIPEKYNEKKLNWKEIKQKYDIEGIKFKDGFPDFGQIGEYTVMIESFSRKRKENFMKAQKMFLENNVLSKNGKENICLKQCTWHECEDMKTLILVPKIIHGNIPHTGGIAILKGGKNDKY